MEGIVLTARRARFHTPQLLVALAILLLAASCTAAASTPTLAPQPTATPGQSLNVAPFTREDLLDRMKTSVAKDAIPAILDPQFVPARDVPSLFRDEEFVIGVSINGDSRAYPIDILSWHEIVNDVVGGEPIAVTW